MLFKILKIPGNFLNTPSDTWNNDQSYLNGLQISKNIKVCNELTERAIKLTQDYCHPSKSKDSLQVIVKVVEKNRTEVLALHKKTPKNIRSLTTMNSIFFSIRHIYIV